MARRPTLRPFFTYYGGKWRTAPHFPAPIFSRIVEPFAGSAGYSLRHPEREVLLYDADEHVAGTWDYLIRTPEAELARLPLYDGTWTTTDDLTHLPQEARWLIGWWLNKGAATPCKTPSRWMRDATVLGENLWGAGVRDRIVRQVPYIRHWRAFHAPHTSAPLEFATWHVDPPYQVAGRHYRVSSVDYAALAEWCQALPGQVMVCENEGATWLPFEPFRNIKATHGRGRAGVSREVLWRGGVR